jgi:hypothetical protein
MMTLLPLHGRRIHIAGNVDCAPSIATAEELKLMRDFVREFLILLMKHGAT